MDQEAVIAQTIADKLPEIVAEGVTSMLTGVLGTVGTLVPAAKNMLGLNGNGSQVQPPATTEGEPATTTTNHTPTALAGAGDGRAEG